MGVSSRNIAAYECMLTYVKSCHDTLQHTATHCNTLQHTATHCNTLQHTATHCNTLQHTAPHCNTLQHPATHCNTLRHTATHSNTLQHTATHCNIHNPNTLATGWRRPIGCLICIRHCPHKSPILVALVRKETCILRHPLHLRRPVCVAYTQFQHTPKTIVCVYTAY